MHHAARCASSPTYVRHRVRPHDAPIGALRSSSKGQVALTESADLSAARTCRMPGSAIMQLFAPVLDAWRAGASAADASTAGALLGASGKSPAMVPHGGSFITPPQVAGAGNAGGWERASNGSNVRALPALPASSLPACLPGSCSELQQQPALPAAL
jgi:hypothetical protein